MIIYHGDRSRLVGECWFVLEISLPTLTKQGNQSSIIKRLSKTIRSFGSDAVELFCPVLYDQPEISLKTDQLLFCRSTSFRKLWDLRRIEGAGAGLLTSGDSRCVRDAIPIDDDYVQSLIRQAQEERNQRIAAIKVGSFVRILDGEMRDCHGFVTVIGDDGLAAVEVRMLTRVIICETPVGNLLSMDHVPTNQRVWYWCPTVRTHEENRKWDSATLPGLRSYYGARTARNQKIWDSISPDARKRHSEKLSEAVSKRWSTADPLRRQYLLKAIDQGRQEYLESIGRTPKDKRKPVNDKLSGSRCVPVFSDISA